MHASLGAMLLEGYAKGRTIERSRAIGAPAGARPARGAALDIRRDGAFFVLELVRESQRIGYSDVPEHAAGKPLSTWPETAPKLRKLVRRGLEQTVTRQLCEEGSCFDGLSL